jgi:hypothetical protein
MNTTLTPAPAAGSGRSKRSASSARTQRIRVGLAIFVVADGCALGIALVTGAGFVFNVLVWLLFVVLWIAFAAALAVSPATLDELWRGVRGSHVAVQGLVWLLLLPIMVGLWIWVRAWRATNRLLLIAGTAVVSLFLLFPRQ